MKSLFVVCIVCLWACAVGHVGISNSGDPPYLELVKTATEQYLDENEADEYARSYDRTSSDMVDAYNKPNRKASELAAKQQERELQLEALALVTGDDTEAFLRDLDLVNRQTGGFNYCTAKDSIKCEEHYKFRFINGTCNNLANPQWGMALAQHKRRLPNAYQGGKWNERALSENTDERQLPNPRVVSNALHGATGSKTEDDLSMAIFAWGQFLDHDFASTPLGRLQKDADCCKRIKTNRFCMAMNVPAGDPYFNNGYCMNARRSDIVNSCEDRTVKNQYNQITSFIDGSNVYGSIDEEAHELRSGIGGQMKTENNFPPNGHDVTECIAKSPIPCLKCGDHRANVVPTLASLHSLFVREHNRIAAEFSRMFSDWDDEKIYQETRRIIIAIMQKITYGDFLPKFLSDVTMRKYDLKLLSSGYSRLYDASLDPTIANSFMIAFRFGHSWIPEKIRRLGNSYKELSSVPTEETLLTPHELFVRNYGGINDVARFTAQDLCPNSDAEIEDSVRNKMFETPKGKDGFDLMMLNIRREREWGVPGYVKFRQRCGYRAVTDWTDLLEANDTHPATHDEKTVDKLRAVYSGSVLDIDLLPGLLTELDMEGSVVGPTLNCMLGEQFRELKLGDRFWFENFEGPNKFELNQMKEIRKMTLSKVMCNNLDIETIGEDAFVSVGASSRVTCASLRDQSMDLGLWRNG